jgi:hypothetical protein
MGGITKGQAVTYTLSDGKKIQKVTGVVTGTGSVVRAVSFQSNGSLLRGRSSRSGVQFGLKQGFAARVDKLKPGFTGGRVDPPQPEGVAVAVMKVADFFVVGSGFR